MHAKTLALLYWLTSEASCQNPEKWHFDTSLQILQMLFKRTLGVDAWIPENREISPSIKEEAFC